MHFTDRLQQRRQDGGGFGVLRHEQQHGTAAGSNRFEGPVPILVGQPPHLGGHRVETRAAGDLDAAGREPPRLAQVAGGVLVEDERQVGQREPGIPGAAGGRHLVGLVEVVQPVAVDEAVLQAGERHAAPPRLERERASPSTRFGVGECRAGFQGVQRGPRFVHGARGPRELQERHPGKRVRQRAPAVAAVDHREVTEIAARMERPADRVARGPQPDRAGERGGRHQPLDRNDPCGFSSRTPPAPRTEVHRGPHTDAGQCARGKPPLERGQHGADVRLGAPVGFAPTPERAVHERRDARAADAGGTPRAGGGAHGAEHEGRAPRLERQRARRRAPRLRSRA